MATIAEGWAGTAGGILVGDERRKLDAAAQQLLEAYWQGPFVLPPEQLLSQLKEQDAALLTDLVHQLYWEHLGTPGYAQDLTAERTRAIDESRRLWKYSPVAQWLLWLHTNFGFGESIVITPQDEQANEVWQEFWTADRNQPILAADRIAELSNWVLVDGDRFLTYYASTLDGETQIRTIGTKEIVEIITDPDDSSAPLFYKRQWTDAQQRLQTWYYPDYRAFFDEALGRAKLPTGAVQAHKIKYGTVVVMQHIAFNGKDEGSLYGWPFLGTGSPWIRAHKRHLENRLAVSASKAMYVRKATVKGGSRAVDSVIANLRSALSSTQAYETNPPAVAGSTLVENQAVTTTDFPMTTGASDAKVDEEMFARMAGLSGGVFPHYMGMGDAYRLATATAMESPIQRQFSRYQVFWSAQFRKMVRIVLQMKEKYSDATFQTYEAEVSTDKLVEVDLDGMSTALGRVFQTVINPMADQGAIPKEVVQGMLQATLRTVLQALGVDAEEVVGDEKWEVEREEEIEEGGPGSGWFAPPKGTHTGKEGAKGKEERRAGKAPEGEDTTSQRLRVILTQGLDIEENDPSNADWSAREKAKDEVVTNLSKKTGIEYEETDMVIGQWAMSSNNKDMRSLAIQADAGEEFGIPVSEFTEGRIKESKEYTKAQMEWLRQGGWTEEQLRTTSDWERGNPLLETGKQRKLLRAMYESTQADLKAAGFKQDDVVRLRRGIKFPNDLVKDIKVDEIIKIEGNALESWTTNPVTAKIFAGGLGGWAPPGKTGLVIEMDVPINRILSTPRTGFGCLTESEMVTVGLSGEAKIIKVFESRRD